jgi:hypothetical protein
MWGAERENEILFTFNKISCLESLESLESVWKVFGKFGKCLESSNVVKNAV